MPRTKTNVSKQLEKRIDYREFGNKIWAGASKACTKVNTAGTDENLFRLVPFPGYGARVLPLELVPVPGNGAQICARASTKGYVQTWCPGTLVSKSEHFLVDSKNK